MNAFKEKGGFYQDSKGFWGITYRDATGMKKREIVGSYSEAKAKRTQRLNEVNDAKKDPKKASVKKTFNEAAPLFIKDHIENRQSKKSYMSMFNQIAAHFGDIQLGEITTLKVSQYYNDVANKTSFANANRHLGIISKFFNSLIDWNEFYGTNPCTKVVKTPDEEYNPNPLEKEEIDLLMQHLADYIKPCVSFGIYSGLRRQELLGLRWEHIKLKAQTILIPKTKTNKQRTLGINEDMEQILLSLGVQKEGKVFNVTAEQLRYQLTAASKKAGIDHMRPHDMRHSMSVCFLNRTGRLDYLQRLLGHTNIKTTQKYMKFKEGEIASQMSVLNGLIPLKPKDTEGKIL